MRTRTSVALVTAIWLAGCSTLDKDTILITNTSALGIYASTNSLGVGYTSVVGSRVPAQTGNEQIELFTAGDDKNAQRIVAVGRAAALAAEATRQQIQLSEGGSRYLVFQIESERYILDQATGTIYLINGDAKQGLDLSKEIGKIGRKRLP